MRYILYKTVCCLNGKVYYGITNGRKKNYLGSGDWCSEQTKLGMKKRIPGKQSLAEAIKEHGKQNFIRTTIKEFDTLKEVLLAEAEIVTSEYILHSSNYNIVPGGGCPPIATSESSRKALKTFKIKYGLENPSQLPGVGKKISEALRGKPKSAKHREKLRKPKTEEHKRKLSIARKGFKHSGETLLLFSKQRAGRKNPKLSIILRGRKRPVHSLSMSGRFWVNNGSVELMVKELPEQFVLGRLPKYSE